MNMEAVGHLVDLLIESGDTARARHHGEAFLEENPDGERSRYFRWLLQVMVDDGGGEQAAAERLAGAPWRVLRWIVSNGQLLGLGLGGDTDLALDGLRSATQPHAEQQSSSRAEMFYLHNAGRPGEAAAAIDRYARLVEPDIATLPDILRIYFEIYGDGLPAGAAAESLAETAFADPPTDPDAAGYRLIELCAAEQWRVVNGRYDRTEEVVRRLRAAAPPVPVHDRKSARVCATMLDAILALGRGRADLADLADRLEAEHDENLPFFSWSLERAA